MVDIAEAGILVQLLNDLVRTKYIHRPEELRQPKVPKPQGMKLCLWCDHLGYRLLLLLWLLLHLSLLLALFLLCILCRGWLALRLEVVWNQLRDCL
jgi:hypothetical protein